MSVRHENPAVSSQAAREKHVKNYVIVYIQPGGAVCFMPLRAADNQEAITAAMEIWRCVIRINEHHRIHALYDAATQQHLPLDVDTLNVEAAQVTQIRRRRWFG